MRLFGLDGPKILADFAHFTASAGGADESLGRTPYDQRPGEYMGRIFTAGDCRHRLHLQVNGSRHLTHGERLARQ